MGHQRNAKRIRRENRTVLLMDAARVPPPPTPAETAEVQALAESRRADPRRCTCGRVAYVDGWCRPCWAATGAAVVARSLGLVTDEDLALARGPDLPHAAQRRRAVAAAVRQVKRAASRHGRPGPR